jgi:hypothetical protein
MLPASSIAAAPKCVPFLVDVAASSTTVSSL